MIQSLAYEQKTMIIQSNICAYFFFSEGTFAWSPLVFHRLFISGTSFKSSSCHVHRIGTRIKESIRQLTFCPHRPTGPQLTKGLSEENNLFKGMIGPFEARSSHVM